MVVLVILHLPNCNLKCAISSICLRIYIIELRIDKPIIQTLRVIHWWKTAVRCGNLWSRLIRMCLPLRSISLFVAQWWGTIHSRPCCSGSVDWSCVQCLMPSPGCWQEGNCHRSILRSASCVYNYKWTRPFLFLSPAWSILHQCEHILSVIDVQLSNTSFKVCFKH